MNVKVVDALRRAEFSVMVELESGAAGPYRFHVAGSTGYRATLPACPCDRTPCPLPYGHAASAKGRAEGCRGDGGGRSGSSFCHGWHEGSVLSFAARVLKTYGKGVKA